MGFRREKAIWLSSTSSLERWGQTEVTPMRIPPGNFAGMAELSKDHPRLFRLSIARIPIRLTSGAVAHGLDRIFGFLAIGCEDPVLRQLHGLP